MRRENGCRLATTTLRCLRLIGRRLRAHIYVMEQSSSRGLLLCTGTHHKFTLEPCGQGMLHLYQIMNPLLCKKKIHQRGNESIFFGQDNQREESGGLAAPCIYHTQKHIKSSAFLFLEMSCKDDSQLRWSSAISNPETDDLGKKREFLNYATQISYTLRTQNSSQIPDRPAHMLHNVEKITRHMLLLLQSPTKVQSLNIIHLPHDNVHPLSNIIQPCS